MTSSCNDWYINFSTKQDCLDYEEIGKVPVGLDETTTAVATTKITTTTKTTTSTEMTVSYQSNTDLVESFTDLADIYIDDDIIDGTIDEPEVMKNTEVLQDALGDNLLVKGEVKAQIGIDGGLLTIVFSVELAGGALLTYCLYQGMRKIGGYLWKPPADYNQLERSGVPLHDNPAPNPEETIVPSNRDETSDRFTTAIMDSTRINETQTTPLAGFSPIGRPMMNRTTSFIQSPTALPERRLPTSHSQPIAFNLDTDGFAEDLDASAILRQPTLPNLSAIVREIPAAAIAAINAQVAPAINEPVVERANDQPAAEPAINVPLAEPAINAPPAEPAINVFAAEPAIQEPAIQEPAAEPAAEPAPAPMAQPANNQQPNTRYPKRKRSPPKRYGF